MAKAPQGERLALYERVIQGDRVFSSMLAQALHVTKAELATALGLPPNRCESVSANRAGRRSDVCAMSWKS